MRLSWNTKPRLRSGVSCAAGNTGTSESMVTVLHPEVASSAQIVCGENFRWPIAHRIRVRAVEPI